MQRGVSVEQVRRAVKLAQKHGIRVGMFLMWGYEGEEIEDIEATIEHVKRTDPDVFFTTVSYPIKGTPYFQSVANSLVQLKPWGTSSDRELTLCGRRSSQFYENADHLLQREVQLARLRRTGEGGTMEINLQQQVRELRASLYAKSSEVTA
jgi:radical SAM superfamily enzyme YgiQ (UPF0313 family)